MRTFSALRVRPRLVYAGDMLYPTSHVWLTHSCGEGSVMGTGLSVG